MKKNEYKHIANSCSRKKLLMFIQTLEEVVFYYSFESYKLPALNSHYLCYDLIWTKNNIDKRTITEGNFVPLAEEFESILKKDIVIKNLFPNVEVVLMKRDKLGVTVDYTKSDPKTKIGKYTETAEYIREFSNAKNMYISTIYDMLLDNIFSGECKYENFKDIYMLTRVLATELVNGGYSVEYITQELKNTFLNNQNIIKGNREQVIDFINKFNFEEKNYRVFLGINAETARILKQVKDVRVLKPSKELKRTLNLRHKEDHSVEVAIKGLDMHKAAERAHAYVNTVISLHRISQHHKPIYIKPNAQVNEIDENENKLAECMVKIEKNVLLRASNESQIQSFFYDDQLLNSIKPPKTFFRAVSLHNGALDSKEPTNQLLDLWTAVETLVGVKAGDEDKISVICNILTSVLNRAYLYSHLEQLYRDIKVVLEDKVDRFFGEIKGEEQEPLKLTKILAVKEYQAKYDELYSQLEEYPILQYRLEHFSKNVFVNSGSVLEELIRHKSKLRWQIMRIYRNRNMIVHSGEYMPYLNIILGNLHYYVDTMIDVLIEYYHLGIKNNKTVFYDIEKQEIKYWKELGLDEKGKKTDFKEITEENYKTIIFNDYEGNMIKNAVKQAVADMKRRKDEDLHSETRNTRDIELIE